MENKKGCPIPCSDCPSRLDNLSDTARKNLSQTNGALLWFGVKDISLTWIANSVYEDGVRKVELSAEETQAQYSELAESVRECQGSEGVVIKPAKRLLGVTVVAAETEDYCPTIKEEIGEINAFNVINYFTNREETQG